METIGKFTKIELLESINKKEPIMMNPDELEISTTSLGSAILKSKKDDDVSFTEKNNKHKESKYKYVECDICGKTYCVKNSGKHRKTQYHMLHANLNKRMKDMLLGKK